LQEKIQKIQKRQEQRKEMVGKFENDYWEKIKQERGSDAPLFEQKENEFQKRLDDEITEIT
jgi:hypothetical protein